MIRVGVTGGIGSGKSTVCSIFERIGIPIYNADERAKWLMENDHDLVGSIKELFGEDAYLDNNRLNRKHIADIAFNDQSKLEALNNLVHPAVGKDGEQWMAQQVDHPYAIKEAALLIEAGSYKKLDKLIVVTAPISVRLKRVMDRDSSTLEEVKSRMNNQLSDEERDEYADFVINNDGEQALIPQVLATHKILINLEG